MPAVDPLILEIRADMGRFRAELQSTTALVTAGLGRQEKSVQSLERQIQRSSGAISGSLKGIAASLAGAFSVQQIGGLIDNFTRLQNSLRVSGLEGQALADVQSRLLVLSTQYGVSINELAGLYGKSSQAAAELGATESDLLQVTEASAQALKITGTSAAQAQGALLGLTQALSAGTVRAEEFNQINEGGLRPLLQAAANTERFGGSVAKLRAAVVDGTVTSQEFYRGILNGSAELDAKASKATLTLAGAFTALGSQLTVYVGQASSANGVTATLSAAIALLADNIDVIIPALAVVAASLGVGLVTNSIAARFALAGVAAQAAGTSGAFGIMAVSARGAGVALLGAFGGPIGIAVTALTLGIGYLVTQTDNASAAVDKLSASADKAESEADAMEERLRAAGVALNQVSASGKNAAEGIDATSRAAAQAQKRLKALEDQSGVTALKLNALRILELQGQRDAVGTGFFRGLGRGLARGSDGGNGFADRSIDQSFKDQDNSERALIDRQIAAQRRQQAAILTGIKSGVNVTDTKSPSVASSVTPTKTTGERSRSGGASASTVANGPSSTELNARANSEQLRLDSELLQATLQLTQNAKERDDIQKELLNIERQQRLDELASNESLTESQRNAQKEVIDQLFGVASKVNEQGDIVTKGIPSLLATRLNIEKEAQLSQEAASLADEQLRLDIQRLETEYDLATSIADRAKIAAQIVDTETQAALAAIDRQLLDADIANAKKEELRLARQRIVSEGIANKRGAALGNQTPLQAEITRLQGLNFGDETDKFGIDALNQLNSGLADAIVNGGNLGDVLEDTGKRFLAQLLELTFQLLVIKPLLESLGAGASGGGGGSSGGGFGAILAGLFKAAPQRASGGQVNAGQLVRVNEGVGKEFFRPSVGGNIIPLSKMNAAPAAGGQGGGVSVIRLELSGDVDARIQSISAEMAVEVVRAAAPSIQRGAVNETFRRGQRPNLGR